MKSPFLKRPLVFYIPFLLLAVSLHAQKAMISEVGYNSEYSATTFGAIIEIQNYGDTPLDLTGYSIADPSTGYDTDNERTYLSYDTVGCAEDMILAPNEVLSVFRFLNKNSQTIHLYTADNELISSVSWGDSPYFVAASEAGIWQNGPTPIVPDGGAIVNIGNGTSWLDWVAVSERTPCVAENNSGQTTRKKVLVFQAEDAKKAKTKLAKAIGDESNKVVSPNKKGAYLEWNIEVSSAGTYEVFLSYSNTGNLFDALKGTLTVNNRNNSLVQFSHSTSADEQAGTTWLNEFTKVHLDEGVNTVRFTATNTLRNSQVVIDYLGLVTNELEGAVTSAITDSMAELLPSGYCNVQSSSAKDEWISNFKLGSIDNNSGGAVFSDFSELATELVPGGIYNFSITPAWSGTVYNEAASIWIDYNRNGSFDDEGEKVVSRAPSRASVMSGSFTIPKDAVAGATKIRVVMKYNGEPTLACSSIENGEVEEYTAIIKENKELVKGVAIAKIKPAISLFPLPVTNELNIDIAEAIEKVEIFNMQGQLVLSEIGMNKINTQSLGVGSFIIRILTATNEYTKQITSIR